jgi:hypothetical protein
MLRMRIFAIPLLILTVATTAQAKTYWVSPTGQSGASGADSVTNATTLAWFNANAVAGDVCRFKSGAYSDPVRPGHNGNSSARIRYYGFPQDPGAVLVADVHFGYQYGSYCTARWVSCTTDVAGMVETAGLEATDDSIAVCRFTGQTGGFSIGSMRSVVDSVYFSGTYANSGQTHAIQIAGERDHANGTIGEWTIGSRSNSFTNSTVTMVVNCPGDFHGMLLSTAAYNRIAGNTFNVTLTNCGGYFFGLEMYEGYYNQLQGNTWNITLNGPIGGSHGVWCHRDSSSYNRFVGNTVNIMGTGADLSFMLSNGGSFPGTTGHNYYGNNLIKDHSPQVGTGVLWWYDGTRADTVEFNTVMTDAARPGAVVASGQPVNGSVFRHNTFWTGGATAVDLSSATAVNGPKLVSNIFYCGAANRAGAENIRVPAGVQVDSAGVFFTPGGSSPNWAIAYAGKDGAPGSGGNFGASGKAVWGTPVFADSNYATFNGTPSPTGFAALPSLTDGYAGAIPFGAGSPDTTPPATVSDLAVTLLGPHELVVSWTAPGNDGRTGTASLYDLRWSSGPITAANFAQAIPVAVQPVPAAALTPQNWVAQGLSLGTTYYYAIRARDAAGNWSGVSNSPSGTTPATDTMPPAAIHDLR